MFDLFFSPSYQLDFNGLYPPGTARVKVPCYYISSVIIKKKSAQISIISQLLSNIYKPKFAYTYTGR